MSVGHIPKMVFIGNKLHKRSTHKQVIKLFNPEFLFMENDKIVQKRKVSRGKLLSTL